MQKSKLITAFIYSYIALPFLIFAAGFLKLQFAIPVSACIILAVFLASRDSEGIKPLSVNRTGLTRIAAGVILIIAIVLLSGIGNIFWQNNDHATRNTLFDILVNFSWPPKYVNDAGTETGIVYYIGFWLPSAVLGKLAGLEAGYIFQIVWAALGLCIIWYLLCAMHKKVVLYPLVMFLFFSGMDIIGNGCIQNMFSQLTTLQKGTWAFSQGSPITTHIEWWASYFQYSSHTTQLFWVFNQCIPVWIATLLLLVEKNNKNLVFIMGLTLLSSTLPFIGLIPIFVWCAVCDHEGELLDRPFTRDVKKSFFSLFTFQNVVGGGLSGILSFLYLIGNIASTTSASSNSASAASGAAPTEGFSLFTFTLTLIIFGVLYLVATSDVKRKPSHILYFIPIVMLACLISGISGIKLELYILFVLFEFVLLSLLIIPAYGKSSLFFITVSCLFIIPFFKVGKSIDFCMRASIPPLVVLCLFSINSLRKYFSEKKYLLATLLCAILLIGAATPVKEIARTIEATVYEVQTKGSVQNDNKTVQNVFSGKNFTGKTKGNLFFEVFSK